MSGTKEGGQAAAKTIIKRYGPEYFHDLGKLGGEKGTGHSFAHGKLDQHEIGRKGGLANKGRRKEGVRARGYSQSYTNRLRREGKLV